jgi:hypothetical protein
LPRSGVDGKNRLSSITDDRYPHVTPRVMGMGSVLGTVSGVWCLVSGVNRVFLYSGI